MRVVAVMLGLCLAGPAWAAEGAASLSGEATIGGQARHVALRLACDPAHAGLSAELTVPRVADLAPRFDFGAFGGAGPEKPLTALRVAGPTGVRSMIAPARGAAASDEAGGYTLTVAAARRSENPLRGIAPGLAEAGARITWTQTSPRAGDATLVATFPVNDPAQLRAALGPCLDAIP